MKSFFLIIINLFFSFSFAAGPVIDQVPLKQNDTVRRYLKQIDRFLYNDLSEAERYANQAEKYANKISDTVALHALYFKKGKLNYVKGNYEKSLQYYMQALRFYERHDQNQQIAQCYIGLGAIQQAIKRHTEAVRLFERSLMIAEKSSAEEVIKASAYANMAVSNIALKKYLTAKANLEKAKQAAVLSKRDDILHMVANRFGELAFLNGDYYKAIARYHKLLQDSNDLNNWEKAFAYDGLAKSYLKLGEVLKAEKTALKGYKFAKQINAKDELVKATDILSMVYVAKEDKNKAVEFLLMHQQYQDSIYSENYVQQIGMAHLEQQEIENQKLLIENESARKELVFNRILIIVGVVISLVLIYFLFQFRENSQHKAYLYKELEKKNKEIEKSHRLLASKNKTLKRTNNDKDKLFSVLSHDLKTPIDSMKQLMELMREDVFSEDEKQKLLEEMHLQLNNTSFMLHNLLKWASSQLKGSNLKKEKTSLVQDVRRVVKENFLIAKTKPIEIIHELPQKSSSIVVDRAHLRVVLQNLLSNAIKYAEINTFVKLSYEINEKSFCLKVFNKGEPITKAKIDQIQLENNKIVSKPGTLLEQGTGLGLLLVQQYLRLNKATLEIKSIAMEGTEFKVCFPIAD